MYEKDYQKLYEQEKEQRYWEEQERINREHDAYLEREQQRRDREKQYKYSANFEASTWREAFRKNKRRLAEEHRGELDTVSKFKNDPEPYTYDGWWLKQIRINEDAESFIDQELRLIGSLIKKLQGFIEKLQQRARKRAYQRLVEKYGLNDVSTVECMIDGDPEDLLQW